MENVLLSGESKDNLKLLIRLAKKLGVKTKILTEEEMEDMGMSMAIREGQTGEFVNTNDFLKKLREG